MGTTLAFVGSRTTRERLARGVGLSVYEVEPDMARWTLRQTIELINPSYLLVDAVRRTLYAVHGDYSDASSFTIEEDGRLRLLSQRPTRGRNPVHLDASPDRWHVVVANYASGSVSALSIGSNGELVEPVASLQLEGVPGPRHGDQSGSHPHQVIRWPGTGLFIVPNKGLDRVQVVRLAANGDLSLAGEATTAPGAGPRHAALDPESGLLWVCNELDSTVTTFRFDPPSARLVALGTTPLLPPGYHGTSTCAGIVKRGPSLFVSNRGHDSIVTMKIDARTGLPEPVQWTPTLGTTPRFITLSPDGTQLLVANEGSDSIVRHRINSDGLLDVGEVVATTGSPVCIAFVPFQP
ncbi:MAG: lactonase family protein [Piscinibacter sp.]